MKAIVYSKTGKKKKDIELNPAIFDIRVNERLLALVDTAYAGNSRRGTHSTKTRKEVRGGGKKPWRQKGTGRARHGSIRSPIWRGGGIVFGPHPRDYNTAIPKNMRKQAIVSALSLKGKQSNLFLVEDVETGSAKTKDWVSVWKKLPLDGKRALCVVKNLSDELKRASRNYLKVVKVKSAEEFNAHHVMQREKLVIDEQALEVLEQRLIGSGAKATPKAGESEVNKETKKKAAKKVSKATAKKKAPAKKRVSTKAKKKSS